MGAVSFSCWHSISPADFFEVENSKNVYNHGFLACWFYTCILSIWSRRAGLLHPSTPTRPNPITFQSLSLAAFWYAALLNSAIWLRLKSNKFAAYWHLPKLNNLQSRNFKTALNPPFLAMPKCIIASTYTNLFLSHRYYLSCLILLAILSYLLRPCFVLSIISHPTASYGSWSCFS